MRRLNKMRYLFTLLVIGLFTNIIYAQATSTYIPKITNIPTSPEAALLGRFGDIPVGYYTGTADISIPIYTIKEAGVEIPIQLRYHSSGIKVEDEATWVGLGWDLSPGGAIIQEVRGKRDEFDNFYYPELPNGYLAFKNRLENAGSIGNYKSFRQKGNSFYNVSCTTYFDPLAGRCILPINIPTNPDGADSNNIVGGLFQGHGDPDIYHYNFAGYSGKFYINFETHEVVLIDKKTDLNFVKNGQNSIIATTLDGNKFYFDIIETSYYLGFYENSEKSGKTFKLSSIHFNNGKQIDFTYQDAHISKAEYSQYAILNSYDYFYTPNAHTPTLNTSATQNDIKILTSITTSDAIINFNLENREDINLYPNDNLKKLKSIDIKSRLTGKKIKSFEFSHSYFPYNLIGAPLGTSGIADFVNSHLDVLGKRLKLDKVKEVGYNSEEVADSSKPSYQFEYNITQTMPLKVSFAKDFYGYYNGENNTGLLPDLDYFDYSYLFLTETNNIPLSYEGYYKSNRYTNNNYSSAYMLNKIIYPTGGSTKFEYESNSFTNQFIPDKTKEEIAHKINLLEDKNSSVDVISKNFKPTKAITISFDNTIYNGAGGNAPFVPYTYSQMEQSYIEFLKVDMSGGTPNYTSIKKWDLSTVLNVDFIANNGKKWIENLRIEYDSNPNVSYTVITHLQDNLANNTFGSVSVKSRFTYYDDFGIDTTISNQCGIRVKSIKNYSQNQKIVSNKSLTYYEGKILNHFDPFIRTLKWSFSCVNSTPCPHIDERGAYTEFFISDRLIKGDGLIGYGRVEEQELSENNDNIGKKIFTFLNFVNLSSNGVYDVVPNLQNGLPFETFIYSKTLNLLRNEKYRYENNYNTVHCFYGIKSINNYTGNTDPLESTSGDVNSRSKYTYCATPIISEWNILKSKETKEYFNGSAVTTTEDYTYDTNGNIKTIKSSNSNNVIQTKTYSYADNISDSNIIETGMIANKMIGIPLSTEIANPSGLLSKNRIKYDFSGTILLPKYIFASKGADSLEKKVTYDSYDDKANITQYTLEGGISTVIIWGYNQTLPIAKIENTTYNQIQTYLSNLQTTSNTGTETSLLAALTALRIALPDLMVTTYTHKPLIGVSTITDPKGNTIYYNYDAFGRLENVKDKAGNIISKNEYNYKIQN